MRTLALALVLVSSLRAAEPWLRIATPHFELYTNAGEKKGREAILHFEQVRSFFMDLGTLKEKPEPLARIIAFRSERDFIPYRTKEFAVAYYASNRKRDYIVMQSISQQRYPVAIHEYVHLVVRHSGLKLPIWLNEGLAEFYSTLRPVGKQAMLGELIPGRVREMQSGNWIALETLTSVGQDSPYYNEKNKAGLFYSESWALAHMLRLAPEYGSGFQRFVSLIVAGKPAGEAFPQAFGKSMKEVEGDLRGYFKRQLLFAGTVDVKLEKSAENPEVSPVTALDTELVLADLHVAIRKPELARAAYNRLAKENPGKPEIEEALGYLAWQENKQDEAREHFGRALAAGTTDAQMCYQYALLDGGSSENAVRALERAVTLKPDYTEARLQLGLALLQRRRYAQSRTHLLQIAKVDRDTAFRLFSALAFVNLQLKHAGDARKNAELAKKWAKSPADIRQAEQILEYLDQPQRQDEPEPVETPRRADGNPRLQRRPDPPTDAAQPDPAAPRTPREPLVRAEGKVVHLDCLGSKALLHIATARGKIVLDISNNENIVLKRSAGAGPYEFKCGPQEPFQVAVEYLPRVDEQKRSIGELRVIEF
jgi:Flp pilus assembly protein TadD